MAAGSGKVVIAALIGNALIAVAKFLAAAMTGSSAMFSEAVHSVVDTGNQGLLLLGKKRAERPADVALQSGHGRELHFRALIVAMMLFAFGSGVALHQGVARVLDPRPLQNVGWNYAVLGLAFCFEAVALSVARKEFGAVRGRIPWLRALRKSDDPASFTSVFEDSAALVGLTAAFIGVFCADVFGIVRADGVASVVIGLILGLAAITLAIETRGLLIGEGADDDLVQDIIGVAGKAPFVDGVNEARTIHFGPMDVLVNLSVDARDALTAGEVERGVTALEALIKSRHPEITRVFIEIQAARDRDDPAPDPDEAPLPA